MVSSLQAYTAFALVGITSAIITLFVVLNNEDAYQYVWINVIIGAVCLFGMIVLSRKRRIKVA